MLFGFHISWVLGALLAAAIGLLGVQELRVESKSKQLGAEQQASKQLRQTIVDNEKQLEAQRRQVDIANRAMLTRQLEVENARQTLDDLRRQIDEAAAAGDCTVPPALRDSLERGLFKPGLSGHN